jgi:hypothetical protein
MGSLPRLLVASVLAATVAFGTAAPGSARGDVVDRDPEDCQENVPASWSPAGMLGGPAIQLQVLVVLDDVPQPDAQTAIDGANRAYAPLNIALVPTYRKLTLPADGYKTNVDGTKQPTADAAALVQAARASLGGVRPTGIDMVYVATSKDLHLDDDSSVSGYADCTGGIRYPSRAFAAGETWGSVETLGPLNFYIDAAAKIAGHELGHLLGAHHHYANCVQGIEAADANNLEPAACTLMSALEDLQSLRFGSLEALVIRGHAEAARP